MTALMCLAVAIYFEARGEPVDGQFAVGEVIMNRVKSEDYPDTVCDVVFEEDQFSFTEDGKPDKLPKGTTRESRKAFYIAGRVLMGDTMGISSTHYHAAYVKPPWASEFPLDGRIGDHLFYTCTKEC